MIQSLYNTYMYIYIHMYIYIYITIYIHISYCKKLKSHVRITLDRKDKEGEG